MAELGGGCRTSHRVKSQGIKTAVVPGAMTRNTSDPSAAPPLRTLTS